MNRRSAALLLAVLFPVAAAAGAQGPTPASPVRTFTLPDALQYALEHYPSVKAAVDREAVASAGVSVAKAASLPRLDAAWQTNRATFNNIPGLLLPQPGFPGISGPALGEASSRTAWGSAANALLSWEPFDFGLRDAGVRSAEAAVARARAEGGLTSLEVQRVVAATFLAVAHAQQDALAARADVERRTVLARTAKTLADNELRPGAEASRAEAERAAAETRAILARETLAVAEAEFGRVIGFADGPVSVDATALLSADVPPSPPPAADATAVQHPLLQLRIAAVDVARAQEQAVADTFRPRIFLQSAVSARGSGVTSGGSFLGGSAGLGPDRANWAAGIQVVFPNLFDLPAQRARRAAAAAVIRTENAVFDETRLALASQRQAAAAMVEAARAVVANTPIQVAAARQAESQARARYEAGLAGIVEVADAQNLLAHAEYQGAAARVDLWRALLADAAARGDLKPFAQLAGAAGGGR